jgi:hypothetical protein
VALIGRVEPLGQPDRLRSKSLGCIKHVPHRLVA